MSKHEEQSALETLRVKIALAKQMPEIASLPSFGLVIRPGAKLPVCRLCGGSNAPIVDGEHLNPDVWCEHAKA